MSANTSLIQSTFGFLLEAGLQSIVIVPIILVIQFVAGNRLSSTTKHALWFILLVRLSLPIFPESRFSLFQVTQMLEFDAPRQTAKPAIEPFNFQPRRSTGETFDNEALHSPASSISQLEMERTPNQSIETPSLIGQDHRMVEKLPSPTATEFSLIKSNMVTNESIRFTVPGIFVAVWLLGLCCLVLTLLRNTIHYRRLLQSATSVQNRRLLKILEECRIALRVSQRIQIVESPQFQSPSVIGFLSPQLLLPTQICQQYKASELKHIILHELAHVKRRDSVWNWWATIVQIIHWPNPFVWYAIIRQRRDRELATDYLALKALQTDRPEAYGRTLIKTLNSFSGKTAIPGLIAIGENCCGLKKRFQMIAAFHPKRRYSLIAQFATISPLLLLLLTDPNSDQAEAQEPVRATASPNTRNLRLQVIDASTGKPVPNVAIELREYWKSKGANQSHPPIKTETDSVGQATLHHVHDSADQLLVTFRAKGYAVAEKRFFPKENPLMELNSLRIYRSGVIHGIVEDESGRPMKGVKVRLGIHSSRDMDFSKSPIELPVTHDDGKWSYDGIPPHAEDLYIIFNHPTHTYSARRTIRQKNGHTETYGRSIQFRGNEIRELLGDASPIKTTLVEGGQLRGQLLDEEEKPISEAHIRVLHESGFPARSNQWGWFDFPGTFSGARTLQVIAEGYAPQLVEIQATPTLQPLSITMAPSKKVVFKVMNPSKKPIAGAQFIAFGWDKSHTLGTHGLTDQNGDWTSPSVPSTGVDYTVFCDGYHYQHLKGITPREEPYEIILTPALMITFNVNGENDQPIPRFSIRRGRPSPESPRGAHRIRWFEGHLHYGTNGKRSLTLGSKNNEFDWDSEGEHVFKIEAYGYKPFVTRIVDERESPAELSIQMKSTSGQKGFLTTLDGRPIANQSIYISDSEPVQIASGRIRPSGGKSQQIKTDDAGRFILPQGVQSDATLVVACLEGFAMTTVTDFKTLPEVNALPWARLSGTLFDSGKPLPNQRLAISLRPSSGSSMEAPTILDKATTNQSGEFQFDAVPPGSIELIHLSPTGSTGGLDRLIKEVTVEPGAEFSLNVIGPHQDTSH